MDVMHVSILIVVKLFIPHFFVGLGAGLFMIITKFTMNDVGLDDVGNDLSHKLGILLIPSMEYFSHANDAFPMQGDSHIGGVISMVIPVFIHLAEKTIINLCLNRA